jgi:hypothetical protein
MPGVHESVQPTRPYGGLVADLVVEPVGKASKQILRQDGEKADLTECATINDLMLGRGQVTPENIVRLARRTFPTGSFGDERSEMKTRLIQVAMVYSEK